MVLNSVIPEVTARIHPKWQQKVPLHVLVYIGCAESYAGLESSAVGWVNLACQMRDNRLQITVTLAGI